MRTSLELAVLDMAGTTVRDGDQVPRAFAAALAEIGVQITTTELTNVRGSSKREAVRRFVPDTPDGDRVAASGRGTRGEDRGRFSQKSVVRSLIESTRCVCGACSS